MKNKTLRKKEDYRSSLNFLQDKENFKKETIAHTG